MQCITPHPYFPVAYGCPCYPASTPTQPFLHSLPEGQYEKDKTTLTHIPQQLGFSIAKVGLSLGLNGQQVVFVALELSVEHGGTHRCIFSLWRFVGGLHRVMA